MSLCFPNGLFDLLGKIIFFLPRLSHPDRAVLTLIIDHRQRSLAFIATRDVVISVILASLPSLRGVVAAGNIGERRLVTWQKQALHGEISEPERIRHPVRHKVQQLFADAYF